jgi:hypothetical protein
MRGRDGHTYRIVYGGKPGGSLGPDFTDAVVERDDGVTFRGDIEIHVRESDWRAHGHHKDRRYNGVVLHVVGSESNGRPALKATGSTIPLLALNWKKPAPAAANSTELSIPENIRGQENAALPLWEAGLERFHSQAAGIALDIEAFGADQAIWLGILGALGYPRNKRAFRVLANRVDWSFAASIGSSDEIETVLLHAAGLRDTGDEPLTVRVAITGTAPEWVRPWGRPANAPQARITAISALVPIWVQEGGLARTALRVVDLADRPMALLAMFRPADLLTDDTVKVIGAARAAEIVVNVLLPAVFAIGTDEMYLDKNSTHLKNRAVDLYSRHPKLGGNSVTKEAAVALALDYSLPPIKSARDQQGLIALYREMFRHGIRSRQPRLPGV